MYYCNITFQIDNDPLAYIVVESDNEADCIGKLASLFRDVWSHCTYWNGASGMMKSILLAQKAGYTVYPGAGTKVLSNGPTIRVGCLVSMKPSVTTERTLTMPTERPTLRLLPI